MTWYPATNQPYQNRDTVLFLSSSSTSDPKWSSTCWQHICVASVRRSWPWGLPWRWPEHKSPHQSLQPSEPVLRHCDGSVVCAVHWRRMLCWLCSAHWSSSSLTSAVQRWLVCLEHCCRDYSLCWTPPLDYSVRRSEHTTPLLRQLHWLKVPEIIKFRLCVPVHRCLHNKAPPYLAESLHLTTVVDARRRLRSASTSTLTVPSTRRSTIGDRAFPVAVACAWNSLPLSIRTVSSLNAFRDDLKTVLFRASFDDRTRLLPLSLTTDTCEL